MKIEFNKNYVGDSDKIVKEFLKQGVKFDLILTDPPYNLNKDFGNNSDCFVSRKVQGANQTGGPASYNENIRF